MALAWLGVAVRVFSAGAVNADGEALPRWEMKMRLDTIEDAVVYPLTRSG